LPRIIGLDFGTTNTRLQLGYTQEPDRTSPLELPDADRDALPSVILLDQTGVMLEELGKPAVRALLDPARCSRVRYEFKPCLGKDEKDLAKQMESIVLELRCPNCEARIPDGSVFCLKCGTHLPDDYRQTLAERALRYEREDAFTYARLLLCELGKFLRRRLLGDSGWDVGDRVVVGVPVHWTEDTRQRYAKLVAEALGTNKVEPIDEPRAALAEYLWRAIGEIKAGDAVLVIDMGGGTTDLVAGTVQEDGTLGGDVRSHGIRYGGADFDDQIVMWALRQMALPEGVDENQIAGALRSVCRELKEELSDAICKDQGKDNPQVEMLFTSREVSQDLTLDKKTFESEEVAGPLIAVFGEALGKGLAEMGLRAEDVAHVILVGGGTNAYFVEDVARTTLKNAKVVAGQQPEVAVSRGLVLVTAVRPVPATVTEPAAEAKSETEAKPETGTTTEPVLQVDLDEPETEKSDKTAEAEARLVEAVAYVRRHLEKGESRDDIQARLRTAGWGEDELREVWTEATGSSQEQKAASATPAAVALGSPIGLWGPAEAFPDVVDLLEAGKWSEAREKAKYKRRSSRCNASELAEMKLFVRLLADVADRSYLLDEDMSLCQAADALVGMLPGSGAARFLRSVAKMMRALDSDARGPIEDAQAAAAISPTAADAQFVVPIIEGSSTHVRLLEDDGAISQTPITILGYLLLAAALQATDPRSPSQTGVLQVARSEYVDDPGLRVLEAWRDTPLERQLLYWLGNCGAGHRDSGRVASYRRLVEVLEQPGQEDCDLLALAEAEWLIATCTVVNEWSDRAFLTAWAYIGASNPHAVVLLDADSHSSVHGSISPGPGLRVFAEPGDVSVGDIKLHTDTHGRGFVLRIREPLHRESGSMSFMALWEDCVAEWDVDNEGYLVPFACLRDVHAKDGVFWSGLDLIASDGTPCLKSEVWSKTAAAATVRQFAEWREKWGDIADGRRKPEREWLTSPSATAGTNPHAKSDTQENQAGGGTATVHTKAAPKRAAPKKATTRPTPPLPLVAPARSDADALASEIGKTADSVATVELQRVSQFNASWVGWGVYVDGKELGSIAVGESQLYPVKPGVHNIQLRCVQLWSETLSLNAAEGSRTSLKCGVDSLHGRIWLRRDST